MITHDKTARLVEQLFHQSAQESFSLNVYRVEKLFEVNLKDEDSSSCHNYLEIHTTLRKLGVIFSYMTKSNTCGFQRLFDINKWDMLKSQEKQHFHDQSLCSAYGNDHLSCGLGVG